jgi:hypothetical protein
MMTHQKTSLFSKLLFNFSIWEQLQFDDKNTNIGISPNVVSQQMELPTLNTSIKYQIEAPHASTMVVHAPIINDEVTHVQLKGSTNPILPHIMNTPLTTMDPMVDPGITIANLVAQ